MDFELPKPTLTNSRPSKDDEAKIVAYVDGLMMEGYEERKTFDIQADRNLALYLGQFANVQTKSGITPVDLNRIRNVVIAHVQVQTEETPRIRLKPREAGDKPLAFINVNADVGDLAMNGALAQLLLMLAPASYQPDNKGNVAPLSDADKAKVEAAIAAGIVSPDVLVLVNDRIAAEAEQTVFDAMWEECRADFYVREGTFNKSTIGWQFMLYGFDDAGMKHSLYNPSHLLVFIDPTITDIRDAAHAEVLQFLDLNKAIAKWPAYEAELTKSAVTFASLDGQFPFRIPDVLKRTQFQRPMVAIRHCWIRDYPYEWPMELEDAIAGGHVVNDEVEIMPAMTLPQGWTAPATAGVPLDRSIDLAGPVAGHVFRNKAGEATDPFQPNWPKHTRPGIREICIVGDVVVSDKETEFGDIPLPHMVNLPIPYSPFGQGEPEALEALQMALNSLVTDFVNHFKYYGAASIGMPVSVSQRMPGFAKGVYSAPYAERYEIPDDLIAKFGGIENIIGFIKPPPIPADFWKFFELLLSMIDKEGQVTEALQGEGKAHWSGELAARLQEASRGLIAWKSLRLEDTLQYLARLMLHSIRTRMPVSELVKRCSKYPPYVWHAIRERLKTVDTDIEVEIVSGSGQLREREKEEAMALWAGGKGPLSETTLLDRFGEDADAELQNKITEAEKKAKALAGSPMQPQQQPQTPQAGGPVAPAVGAPVVSQPVVSPAPPPGAPNAAAA